MKPLMLFSAIVFTLHAAAQAPVNGHERALKLASHFEAKRDRPAPASWTTGTPVPLESAELIAACMTRFPELGHSLSGLEVLHRIKSPVGLHILLGQRFDGFPVYNGYVKINLNSKGEILSAFNALYPSAAWQSIPASIERAKETVLLVENGQPLPVIRYVDAAGIERLTPIAEQNAVLTRDLRLNFTNDDTLVSGKVFRPDPISPIGKLYGDNGTYRNFNDSDYALLNDQRVDVQFPALLDDSFRLANQYAIITDIHPPLIRPVVSASPQFNFTRSQPGFEEVMSLYHIYNTQQFIQSLGFMNIVNYQLKVDAHSGSADNSYFLFTPDTSLHFGTGGVNDAEDADIIVHEYTHGISHSMNPAGVVSGERRSVEEGLCDAVTAAYSKMYASFNWKEFAPWDGHNEFWNGRTTASSKTYDDFGDPSDYYGNAEIWGSAMSDLIEDLGGDVTIKLLLTSLYSYTPLTTMPEAARLFLQADSLLYASANSWKIRHHFNNRRFDSFPTGIPVTSLSAGFRLRNSAAFAEGTANAVIEWEHAAPARLTVTDLSGRIVEERLVEGNPIPLSPAHFPAGMYLLRLQSQDGSATFRLTRF